MKISSFAFSLALVLLVSSISLNSCKQTEEPDPAVGCTDPTALNYDAAAVESGECSYPSFALSLAHKVGDQDLALNTNYSINDVTVQFETVNFYLDEFMFMDMDGVMADMLDTTLLTKVGVNRYEVGALSTGHKHMLMFTLGVDSLTNYTTDPTLLASENPLAPQSPSMHWSWDNGYIFLRIDGQVDTDGDDVVDSPMEIHIGKHMFATPITMMTHGDATSELFEVNVTFDVAKLFTGVDLTSEFVTHTGDNLPLAQQIQANISTAFGME